MMQAQQTALLASAAEAFRKAYLGQLRHFSGRVLV